MKATFNQEVMLAGWSETHNGGAKVTFWLADSSSLEAFKAMTVAKGKTAGQRLAMCLVEIADDEQPSQRTQAADPIAQAEAVSTSPKVTGLAFLAVQWCKQQMFWDFLNDHVALTTVLNEQDAKDLICLECGIDSRKELNTNINAAGGFNRFIREPYMAYMQKQEAKR